MKKTQVMQYFDSMYDSTYDDAIAFIIGMTGELDNIETILTETYLEIYTYLSKAKIVNSDEIQKYFIDTLKAKICKYSSKREDEYKVKAKIRRTLNSVQKMLLTEFEIEQDEFFESRFHKKIHSFISSKPALIRKVFLLYFYCNYDIEKIAALLQIETNEVTHITYTLLKEIRDTFLKHLIIKAEVITTDEIY